MSGQDEEKNPRIFANLAPFGFASPSDLLGSSLRESLAQRIACTYRRSPPLRAGVAIRKSFGLASALSASIISASIPPAHPTRNGNLTQKIGTHTHEGLIQKIRQHFFQSGRPRRGRRRRLAGAEGGRLKKCDWRIWRRAKPDAFAKIRGFFSYPVRSPFNRMRKSSAANPFFGGNRWLRKEIRKGIHYCHLP